MGGAILVVSLSDGGRAPYGGASQTDLDLDAGVAVIRHTLSEDKGLLHFTDTKNHRPRSSPSRRCCADCSMST